MRGAIANARGLEIERRDDFKAFLFKPAIRKQRATEIADADEHDGLETGRAEQVGDHRCELIHIVTQTARAELPEVGEVFPKLRGLHTCGGGERFAGDGIDAVLFQALQAAQIDGEPIDSFAWDFGAKRLFQSTGK